MLVHLCFFTKFFQCFNHLKNLTNLPGFCLGCILLYDEQKRTRLTETSHRNVPILVLPVWPGTAPALPCANMQICPQKNMLFFPRPGSVMWWVLWWWLWGAQLPTSLLLGCFLLKVQVSKCIAWDFCVPLLVSFWEGFNVSPSVVMTDSPCASTTPLYNNKVNLLSVNN